MTPHLHTTSYIYEPHKKEDIDPVVLKCFACNRIRKEESVLKGEACPCCKERKENELD